MSKYVIDASAWIEYLIGSDLGLKVKDYIESDKNEIFTSAVTIAEIISLIKREKKDFDSANKTIIALSKIYNVNLELSFEVGLFHAQTRSKIKDFGLADAFVFITAKRLNAKIITKDSNHFKDFKEAILI